MALKRHTLSLKIIFLLYLGAIALMLALAAALPFGLLTLGAHEGLCIYANVSELQANEAKPALAVSEPFQKSLVPAGCTYVLLSSSGDVKQSDMEESELQNALGYANGTYSPPAPDDCYMVINRANGLVILHYRIGSRYTVPWMNSNLPNPDKLYVVLIVINCLAGCFIVTTLFAGKLRKHLRPLLDATQKIRQQDLDFEAGHSAIAEFDRVLLSISDMKNELGTSLEKQWRMEQTRREQTSALAHDIRTPLTIIRGNAELLDGSAITGKPREYALHILKNSERMEKYLNLLIDMTKAESCLGINPEKIETGKFLSGLEGQSRGLAESRQLHIELFRHNLPAEFTADASLMERAVINIVSNAADYSPDGGTVRIEAEAENGLIRFRVTDSGKGFSDMDISKASEQFYMGDKSRSSKFHYGMGLYIAKSVAEKHGGSLSLANSPKTGGGMVTIEIPI